METTMFGKEQPEVVSDVDVGNYIKELHETGLKEINNHISGEEDEMAGCSTESTAGTKDSD